MDSSVGAATVAVGRTSVDSSVAGGFVADASGAQAVIRIMRRLKVRKERFVFIFLMNRYSIKSLRKDYKLSGSPDFAVEGDRIYHGNSRRALTWRSLNECDLHYVGHFPAGSR